MRLHDRKSESSSTVALRQQYQACHGIMSEVLSTTDIGWDGSPKDLLKLLQKFRREQSGHMIGLPASPNARHLLGVAPAPRTLSPEHLATAESLPGGPAPPPAMRACSAPRTRAWESRCVFQSYARVTLCSYSTPRSVAAAWCMTLPACYSWRAFDFLGRDSLFVPRSD